jgi:hypothetical protein
MGDKASPHRVAQQQHCSVAVRYLSQDVDGCGRAGPASVGTQEAMFGVCGGMEDCLRDLTHHARLSRISQLLRPRQASNAEPAEPR